MAQYIIKRVEKLPSLEAPWEDSVWQKAETLTLQWHHARSQGTLPDVQVRVLHDNRDIAGIFRVDDPSVIATHLEYNSSVCCDSCVEFFFRPNGTEGYFNLEMSIGGAHLNYYVRDWTRSGDHFADLVVIPEEIGGKFQLRTSRPGRIFPEEKRRQVWTAVFLVPQEPIAAYRTAPGPLSGQRWTGNFYKCGEDLANPHWIGWQATEPLNFHQPQFFGDLLFE